MKNDQYFPHDATASNNLKLMALLQEEGAKGYGIYWFLLEFLRQQHGYRGQMSMLGFLARRIRSSKNLLERIIRNYSLFVVEDETFFSPGLCTRMTPLDESRATKRKQCSNAAKAKWLKISEKNNAGALQEEESKEKESKEEYISLLYPHGGKAVDCPDGNEMEEYFIDKVPEYALNLKKCNFKGLLERLKRLGIIDPVEVKAILLFSNYGEYGNTIWQILNHTNWGKIRAPGKFLIAELKK